MTLPKKSDPIDAARHLADADPRLGLLISRIGPLRLKHRSSLSPFGFLARSIMHQQLAGAAAAAIHTRFCGLFHDGEAEPLKLLRMREATLRSCGLSRAKIASIRDLAAHTVNGSIPTLAELRRIDDEDVIERLTVVRGIGPWTVQMLLMFHLGRPDVLPTADYGVRKGFARVYSKRALPSEKALLRHGEKWRPYRSYASWCFWRALEQPQEE